MAELDASKEGQRERTGKSHDRSEGSDTEVRYEICSRVSYGEYGDSYESVGETKEFPEH